MNEEKEKERERQEAEDKRLERNRKAEIKFAQNIINRYNKD